MINAHPQLLNNKSKTVTGITGTTKIRTEPNSHNASDYCEI